MRGLLVLAALLIGVAGVLGASAAPLSGSWSFSIESDVSPFAIDALRLESVIALDYSLNAWTWGSTAVVGNDGLDNVYFDVRGPLGGIALRSILDFDAASAQFRTWLASGMTSISGVSLYGMLMVDNVGTVQTPSMGSGLTLGGWGSAGELSIGAQMQFNMSDTSGFIYKYGYAWLLDHFIFNACDEWYLPSGYIDVQTSGCTAAWTGADVYLEMPFSCFDLLAHLSLSCANGFDSILFEINDLDLGLPWFGVRWIDLLFEVDSKTVNTVFDVTVGETACITPYLALEGTGAHIEGLSLKALKFAYTSNGVTLKAGELFDTDGWYLYQNYYDPSTRVLGWSWDGELTTMSNCLATAGVEKGVYNEYLGLIVDGDACCGGAYSLSVFTWFDAGGSPGLFDWAETRVNLSAGIGSNVTISLGISATTAGMHWIRAGFLAQW